jgi:hypothetical protein
MSGVVFDPGFMGPQEELRAEVRQRNLWGVLDPRMMELATASGFTERRAGLPWAGKRPHTTADLSGQAGEGIMDSLAEFVAQEGFSAVLTPTHYLAQGAQDPWFGVDLALTRGLRWKLDMRGCQDVALYYVLALPMTVFHNAAHRTAFKAQLQGVEIDGIWLRVHPFGSGSGHVTVQRYIQGCRDLHGLSLPLVAEKTGSIGLPLLAFGAVGGLESGVSSGEKFDFGRLSRPPKPGSRGFAPQARVYVPGLGVFLDRDTARAFFDIRTLRANFGCTAACCRRGAKDTIADPRRHFVYTRMDEVGAIGQVPVQLRPQQYLDTMLRPATDRLGRALQADLADGIRTRLEKERRKLDGWRHTLGEMSRTQPVITSAATPERRAARRRGA